MTADPAAAPDPRLAPYASHPGNTRGRRHEIPPSALRDPFDRDRDRIVHSNAFRRLKHKTQVFVMPDGDHYRTRLTHSLEVAQIGRVMAKALGLHEGLTEALCLAHDLGHPPFGHVGEQALDRAMAPWGGFDHNGNTLRIVTLRERRYADYPGLNLSWEVLEGLAKHNGPVEDPGWALAAANTDYDLDLRSHASLEAQVAAIADDIAYDNHDLDDGIRAGAFRLEDVVAVPFVRENWRIVAERHMGAPKDAIIAEMVRRQIGIMVEDVLAEARRRLHGIGSVEDVRRAGRPLIAFSADVAASEGELSAFLFENMYRNAPARDLREPVGDVVEQLFSALHADPQLLPQSWRDSLPEEEPARARHVGDFIAGMTDRYAMRFWQELGA